MTVFTEVKINLPSVNPFKQDIAALEPYCDRDVINNAIISVALDGFTCDDICATLRVIASACADGAVLTYGDILAEFYPPADDWQPLELGQSYAQYMEFARPPFTLRLKPNGKGKLEIQARHNLPLRYPDA